MNKLEEIYWEGKIHPNPRSPRPRLVRCSQKMFFLRLLKINLTLYFCLLLIYVCTYFFMFYSYIWKYFTYKIQRTYVILHFFACFTYILNMYFKSFTGFWIDILVLPSDANLNSIEWSYGDRYAYYNSLNLLKIVMHCLDSNK